MLDHLEMYNSISTKRIVFAYSIYDVKQSNKILIANRRAIQKLFEAYAQYKGIIEPNRLLDSLTTQARVLLYEI